MRYKAVHHSHLHDHAQVLVVEDEALGVQLLNGRGRQLLAVHDEAAVEIKREQGQVG